MRYLWQSSLEELEEKLQGFYYEKEKKSILKW